MKGFLFAGIHAGIKKNNQKDLGLIYCRRPCTAAALFTKNKVVAAPVILGREKLKNGSCSAVLVNSGNANCFTGEQGIIDAMECARLTAKTFDLDEAQVMVSSTGVIGAPLPMPQFHQGIPSLKKAVASDNVNDFADAILTTDTCRKVVTHSFDVNGKSCHFIGIAKGSGMIRPDMATMLAFICTDAQISHDDLKEALTTANQASFNRISVDGDTSTNDTVLCLADHSGSLQCDDDISKSEFTTALTHVCQDLAKQIVKDGEGATKVVKIQVTGAKTDQDAYLACEAIAHSNLVKTAVYGEDPNWGRITAAAGRSGADVDPARLDLYFDSQPLVLCGKWLGIEAERKVALIMKQDEINIELNLHLGNGSDHYYFCDFSEAYVKINADYRS